jgi:hypothetical protein
MDETVKTLKAARRSAYAFQRSLQWASGRRCSTLHQKLSAGDGPATRVCMRSRASRVAARALSPSYAWTCSPQATNHAGGAGASCVLW